jgi:hypothetical protein
MSLKIILRPSRDFEFEVKAWLTESEATVELLKNLQSAMSSLESLEFDREVMNMTLQLMAADFSTIAAKVKDAEVFDAQVEDIRSLVHRTSDMIDGVVAIGGKVKEATQKITTVGNSLTAALVARQPKK